MEKLRNALETARRKRGMRDQESAPARTAPSPGKPSKWDTLPLIELEEKDLLSKRVMTQTASAQSTPFDILRTKTLLQMQQNGWKRLAITSPMPSSGKSTIASNLAVGLGRQDNLRTMLFDLDLQSPTIHKMLNYQPTQPISKVLTGEAQFEDHCVRISPNVAVAMSSAPENDPTQFLLSEQTKENLDRIQYVYDPDIMIFDMPSVLTTDNTRAFLNTVDCTLIVIRANSTRFQQFDVTEREISEHTNVLGIVMNACRYGVNHIEME